MADLIKCFASDNCSGVHPDIMGALEKANSGFELSYGDDKHTKRALDLFKGMFGASSRTYFVYNGTGANTLGLGSAMRPYHAVIMPYTAHLNIDETGAPEKYTGCKIIGVECPGGKLSPDDTKPHLAAKGIMHHSQPKAASITNPTETGALYSLEEIKALADFLHENDMLLHMDGARIANAAVALGCSFGEMTAGCGVDVLSFGATKNGLMFGEAVVFLNAGLGEDFNYLRKNGTQLHSKMRFISCQFEAYFENDLWKKNAEHANRMARYLYEGLIKLDGVTPALKTKCNSVFVTFPEEMKKRLQKSIFSTIWISRQSKKCQGSCVHSTQKKRMSTSFWPLQRDNKSAPSWDVCTFARCGLFFRFPA